MSRKQIKVEKDDVQAEIMPSARAAYQRNGWTVVEDGSSEEAPQQVEFDADAWSPTDPTNKIEE